VVEKPLHRPDDYQYYQSAALPASLVHSGGHAATVNAHRCQRKSHCSKSAGSARFSEKSVLTADHIPAFLAEIASIHKRFKNCVKHFLTSPAENGTRTARSLLDDWPAQSPTGTECAPVTP
jgi:hypothetical protein